MIKNAIIMKALTQGIPQEKSTLTELSQIEKTNET